MKINVGSTDRVLRIVIGLALIGLAAGMVMAPWLEKWYSRAVRRQHGGSDD